MEKQKNLPVTLKLEIEADGLRQVVKDGRLLEFAETLSTLASEHIKQQLVEHLAEGAVGLRDAGKGINLAIQFDTDGIFGTGPFPPRPWPRPRPWPWSKIRLDIDEIRIRELVRDELANARDGL